jgi:hypothetical protein
MTDKLLEEAVREAHRAYKGSGAEAHVKAVIKDEDAFATALLIAARRKLGPTFLAYEPETLWQELDPPTMNRDKLSAAIGLAVMPAFYWDVRALGATALAFNNEAVFVNRMPHTTPEQLVWAVLEAELVFALTEDEPAEPFFDVEACAYVAAMLFDAGFVVCPEELKFAQEYLDDMISAEGKELKAKVKAAWKEHPKGEGPEPEFEDPALGVQVANLARVHAYVMHRLQALKKSLAGF